MIHWNDTLDLYSTEGIRNCSCPVVMSDDYGHGITSDILEKRSLHSVLYGWMRYVGNCRISSSCSLWSRCRLSAWSRARTWTPPPGPRDGVAAACAPESSAAPSPPCTQPWERKEGEKKDGFIFYHHHKLTVNISVTFYLSSGQAWFPEKPNSEKLFITASSVNRSGLNLFRQRRDHMLRDFNSGSHRELSACSLNKTTARLRTKLKLLLMSSSATWYHLL